jgi:hypothetical protein
MAKGLGIGGLIAAVIAIVLPVVGVYLGCVALLIVSIAALFGDRVFAIATVAICAINFYLLSPSVWLAQYGGPGAHAPTLFIFLALFVVAPVVAVELNAVGILAFGSRKILMIIGALVLAPLTLGGCGMAIQGAAMLPGLPIAASSVANHLGVGGTDKDAMANDRAYAAALKATPADVLTQSWSDPDAGGPNREIVLKRVRDNTSANNASRKAYAHTDVLGDKGKWTWSDSASGLSGWVEISYNEEGKQVASHGVSDHGKPLAAWSIVRYTKDGHWVAVAGSGKDPSAESAPKKRTALQD